MWLHACYVQYDVLLDGCVTWHRFLQGVRSGIMFFGRSPECLSSGIRSCEFAFACPFLSARVWLKHLDHTRFLVLRETSQEGFEEAGSRRPCFSHQPTDVASKRTQRQQLLSLIYKESFRPPLSSKLPRLVTAIIIIPDINTMTCVR